MMRASDALANVRADSEFVQARREHELTERTRWFNDLPAPPVDLRPAARSVLLTRRGAARVCPEDVAFLDLACDMCGTRLIDASPGMTAASLPAKFTAVCLGCGWSVYLTTQLRHHVWLIDQET